MRWYSAVVIEATSTLKKGKVVFVKKDGADVVLFSDGHLKTFTRTVARKHLSLGSPVSDARAAEIEKEIIR